MRLPVPLSSLLGAFTLSLPAVAYGDAFIATQRNEPFVELTEIPGIHDVTEHTFASPDEAQVAITLPFEFDFLGSHERIVNLGTNGILTFGPGATTTFANQIPGTAAEPNSWIAPFWDDLVHRSVDGARSGIVGTDKHRVFIVEGGPASHYGQTGGTIRYQVWFFEGPEGHFEYRVSGTSLGTFHATIGYEGPDGAPFSDPIACSSTCGAADLASIDDVVFSVQRALAPELTGSLAGFPRGALPGAVVSGEVTIRNVGLETARGVLATIYLSKDAVLDPSDVAVGTTRRLRVAGLDIPTTVTTTISVPPGTRPEDDHLLLEVDTGDSIRELDESDNVVAASVPFATAPDVATTAVAAVDAAGASPGESITFDVTVENRGAPVKGPLSLELFASEDGVLGPTDVSMGATEVQLHGRAFETVRTTVTVPNVAPGSYFPIAVSDADHALVELSLANNAGAGAAPFPTVPDFGVGFVHLPERIGAHGRAQITTRLASEAVRYRGPLGYRLVASRDAQIDASDVTLGDFQVSFAGERFIDDTRSVTFPSTLTAGRYTVLAVLDPDGRVAELQESNNIGASADSLAAGVDLTAQGPVTVSPRAAEAGEVVTIRATLANSGSPYVGPVPYRIYLSPDGVLDPADDAVFDGTLAARGDATQTITATFAVPHDAIVRGYNVAVAIDPDNTIPEASDTNNSVVSTDTLQVRGADLRIVRIDAPPMAFSGLPYRVELTLANEGAAAARGFRYAYYLSDNDLIRFTDRQIFVSETTTIAAGATATFSEVLDMPVFTSTRSIYLGVIVDVYSRVPETSEGNNIGRLPGPISVVFPIPNLRGQIVETATAAAAGESLAVTRLLGNDGVEDAPHFDYAYYLSSNPDITTDDILIGRKSGSLAIGEDDFAIDMLHIPASVAPGVYFLGLILDPDGTLGEVRENDNVIRGPSLPLFAPALVVVTDQLPNAMVGMPYRASIMVSGAPLGLAFRIQSGALPRGLTLDAASGLISGTATEEGLSSFAVRALSGTAYAERALTLRAVSPTVALKIATQALPTGMVGRDYRATIVAVGGVVPYRFSTASRMPGGLTVAPDGSVSGTPEAPGQTLMIVQVEDAVGSSATLELPLNIVNPGQSLAIAQSPLPAGVVGQDYCGLGERVRVQATGGVAPYAWRTLGDQVPGLTLDGLTGELCGTPEREGQFPLMLRVQDATGAYDTAMLVVHVEGGTDLSITTVLLPSAKLGEPYAGDVGATRGDAPYSFSIIEPLGALPPGLALDTDGHIFGTPTQPGVFAFEVQVVDARLRLDVQPLAIEVLDKASSAYSDGGGCGCTATGPTSTGRLDAALSLFLLGAVLWASRRRRVKAAIAVVTASIAVTHAIAPTPAHAQAATAVAGTPYMRSTKAIRYTLLVSPDVLLTQGDDDDLPVHLPFPFRFYETEYQDLIVGANGAIVFGTGAHISLGNPSPGSASSPNAYIAPFWDDMQVFSGVGTISTQLSGTAPNRVFAIEYRDIGRYGLITSKWNAQIRLYEGRGGRIDIDYGAISGGASFSSTMAMEDEVGGRVILFSPSGCTMSCGQAEFAALTDKRVTLVEDPGVELTSTGVSAPEVGLLGGSLAVRGDVANLHGERAGPFHVSVLLSKDRGLGDPTRVGTATVTLPPFGQATVDVACSVPASLAEGLYWVGLFVDSDGKLAEASETNNVAVADREVRLLEARPDLVIQGVWSNSTSAAAAGTVRVRVRASNPGSLATPNGAVAIMLSTNPVMSPEDAELARYALPLGPGETDERELDVTIPAAASSGRFYLGALADPDGVVEELSESNNGRAATTSLDVSGAGIRIITTELPIGVVGESYVGLLMAAGGGAARTWRVTEGHLPEGLGLVASSGEIYGRPRAEGTQSFSVTAESEGASDTRVVTLTVMAPGAPLTVVTRDLPEAVVGQEYAFQLVAAGGSGQATSWSARGLPAGLQLSPEGLISGTPGAIGTSTVSVSVVDGSDAASRDVRLTVRAPTGLLIDPVSLPTGRYGEPYRFTLSASGGIPPIMFHVDSGALPEGLTLSPEGVISGTPAEVSHSAFRFVVNARDSAPAGMEAVDSNTFELRVDDVGGFRIALDALPDAIVGEGYDVEVSAEGGELPYAWSIDGQLPEGFASAHTDTGALRIAGLAQAPALSPLVLRAVDARGRTAERALALRILSAPPAAAKDSGCGCTTTRSPARAYATGWVILALSLAAARKRRARR